MFKGSKQLSDSQWSEIFETADKNNDGKITLNEFKDILQPLLL